MSKQSPSTTPTPTTTSVQTVAKDMTIYVNKLPRFYGSIANYYDYIGKIGRAEAEKQQCKFIPAKAFLTKIEEVFPGDDNEQIANRYFCINSVSRGRALDYIERIKRGPWKEFTKDFISYFVIVDDIAAMDLMYRFLFEGRRKGEDIHSALSRKEGEYEEIVVHPDSIWHSWHNENQKNVMLRAWLFSALPEELQEKWSEIKNPFTLAIKVDNRLLGKGKEIKIDAYAKKDEITPLMLNFFPNLKKDSVYTHSIHTPNIANHGASKVMEENKYKKDNKTYQKQWEYKRNPQYDNKRNQDSKYKIPTCYYCNKRGHLGRDCWQKQNDNAANNKTSASRYVVKNSRDNKNKPINQFNQRRKRPSYFANSTTTTQEAEEQ